MLAHSPPLPLVIDHVGSESRILTPDDRVGIKLALRHHHRVGRIRIATFLGVLRTLIESIDKEFPILEHLSINPLAYSGNGLVLPETFRAPNLRHLVLVNFSLPVGSSFLATSTGLVTFSLELIPPSVSWRPTELLHRASSMPHLQTLAISFRSDEPNQHVGRWMVNTRNKTHVLANLRWLVFQGDSTYLEALLPRMTTPRLEGLHVHLFNEPAVSVTNIQQFISSVEILKFTGASLGIGRMGFALQAYPIGSRTYASSVVNYRVGEDWPLSSTAQMLGALGPVFSGVIHLSVGICDKKPRLWLGSPRYNEADRAQWREILTGRSFNNVKTLRVEDGLIREISRALKVRDEESAMDLLPELNELICGTNVDADDLFDPFAAFIEARQFAGHPVTLINR